MQIRTDTYVDPYTDPTPVTVGGDPALGTRRPIVAKKETRMSTAVQDECIAPDRESDAPEVLSAWYSGFAYAETYRKVVLAQCKELVRARYAAGDQKISEARIEDLSRQHPIYLDYLVRHLKGRQLYELQARADGGMR